MWFARSETAEPKEVIAKLERELAIQEGETAIITGHLAEEYERYSGEGSGTKETLTRIFECDATGDRDKLDQIGRRETRSIAS